MCDTLGIIRQGTGIFGKNSDRDPREAQVVEWHPPKINTDKKQACTYMEVQAVPQTYGVLLSRPAWLWGAEIGVNECGVAIGNEALYTKGEYAKTGLTGMDLLRLALERSQDAGQALQTIIALLERYGQGGNCGYAAELYYDNAFLIMDHRELYVLQTVGKSWSYQKLERACISNCFSIGAQQSPVYGAADLAQCADPVGTQAFGGEWRLALSQTMMQDNLTQQGMLKCLRAHQPEFAVPSEKGSIRSVCMHNGTESAAQSTASMMIVMDGGSPVAWISGGAMPCLSLYKPYRMGKEGKEKQALCTQEDWEEHDGMVRRLAQKKLPQEFFLQRDAVEEQWRKQVLETPGGWTGERFRLCQKEEREFYRKWETELLDVSSGNAKLEGKG